MKVMAAAARTAPSRRSISTTTPSAAGERGAETKKRPIIHRRLTSGSGHHFGPEPVRRLRPADKPNPSAERPGARLRRVPLAAATGVSKHGLHLSRSVRRPAGVQPLGNVGLSQFASDGLGGRGGRHDDGVSTRTISAPFTVALVADAPFLSIQSAVTALANNKSAGKERSPPAAGIIDAGTRNCCCRIISFQLSRK